MSFFFNRGKGKLPSHGTYRLTQEGKDKLSKFDGNTDSRILVALETQGTSDIDEISQASGLPRGTVEKSLPKLLGGGYIVLAGGAGVDEE
jgi:hypothetical protein